MHLQPLINSAATIWQNPLYLLELLQGLQYFRLPKTEETRVLIATVHDSITIRLICKTIPGPRYSNCMAAECWYICKPEFGNHTISFFPLWFLPYFGNLSLFFLLTLHLLYCKMKMKSCLIYRIICIHLAGPFYIFFLNPNQASLRYIMNYSIVFNVIC